MLKISSDIIEEVRSEIVFNPFSNHFDQSKLTVKFESFKSKEDEEFKKLIQICNHIFQDSQKLILQKFDSLALEADQLIEFFTLAINTHFLELLPIAYHSEMSATIEVETAAFSKFETGNGNKISSRLALEMGADILSELITFSRIWDDGRNGLNDFFVFDLPTLKENFHPLWILTNNLINVKSAYHTVLYEHGIIIFESENSIKILSGIKALPIVKNVGMIRFTNITQEFLINLYAVFKYESKKKKGVSIYNANDHILTLKDGKYDAMIRAKADCELMAFYPHLSKEKLTYFDGLTLIDLLDIFNVIDQGIFETTKKYLKNNFEIKLKDIPIKFREMDMINFISKNTGKPKLTVKKVIDTLIADIHSPYFWKTPFYRIEEYLYFALPSVSQPNHCLFFDRWLNLAGFTSDMKVNAFIEYVSKEYSSSQHAKYEFKVIKYNELAIDNIEYKNNILFESKNLLVLLEVQLFDFPIEPEEFDSILSSITNATFSLKKKSAQLLKLKMNKEVINLILTNFTNISGLNINFIPVVDLTLFNNYVNTGSIRRSAFTLEDSKAFSTTTAKFKYYNNESEFNEYFKEYFKLPIPIKNIMDRLTIKEATVTSEFINPSFTIDYVDHITDDELKENQISKLSSPLNYQYFIGSEGVGNEDVLNESILYALSEIFNRMAFSSYEGLNDRVSLIEAVAKTKMSGFASLAFYIFKRLSAINGKNIAKSEKFQTVIYDLEEIKPLLEKIKGQLTGEVRLSKMKFEDNIFREHEEKKLISLAIDILSGLTFSSSGDDMLEELSLPLLILKGFSHKYDVDLEFYTSCSNIVDSLNYIHKYQPARDFCEEILLISTENKKHAYGWNLLFRCYIHQKSLYDASIYGSIYFTAIAVLPTIPEYLAVESKFNAIKYMRNFGFREYAKFIYENLQFDDLNPYDEQKISLSYFNTFLESMFDDNSHFELVNDYLNAKLSSIINYGEPGILPWLSFLYNIQRLESFKKIKINFNIQTFIHEFERALDADNVILLKNKIFGAGSNQKEYYINAILNTYETRDFLDFIYEAQHLSLLASNLFQISLKANDMEGILLSGLVFNDQSLIYKNIKTIPGTVASVKKEKNTTLKNKLENYYSYIKQGLHDLEERIILWLLEDLEIVYLVIISKHEIKYEPLHGWSLETMRLFCSNLSTFYFNAHLDANESVLGFLNNPRNESDYNNLVQQEDYENLLSFLSYTNIGQLNTVKEILFYSSIEMSSFPHNLIVINNDFANANIPICNIISIEKYIESFYELKIDPNYSVSAWIPVDDKEFIVEMGFELLEPLLKQMNANIYKTRYPETKINSDMNIFLAHGVTDNFGFKAVYSNPAIGGAILYPYDVFGSGKIAILFICNTAFSKDAHFSNNVVSFTSELINSGYEAVIAPFWPFDFTMSNIWLTAFVSAFNLHFSISESVWLANNKLCEYDGESSRQFKAPAGFCAMHLYGNPNIVLDT